MTNESGGKDKKSRILALWLALGVGAGVALGAVYGNLALWMAIGAGVGVAIGALQARTTKNGN
jgi:hypothetical protein